MGFGADSSRYRRYGLELTNTEHSLVVEKQMRQQDCKEAKQKKLAASLKMKETK
jgi:hypothetical protein